MKKRVQIKTVQWEYIHHPDAEARLKAAYDLLFAAHLSTAAQLTEPPVVATMPHVERPSSLTL